MSVGVGVGVSVGVVARFEHMNSFNPRNNGDE